MKTRTANGEVELTAEMIRRGMRFRHSIDDAFTVARPLTGEVWETKDGARVRPLLPSTTGLLGCDPTIATREDCALYGIAPSIDAGAHRFARLRDGGAVDLHRDGLCMGSVVLRAGEVEHRIIRIGSMPKCWLSERFIGLDARHARPEDVRRLCCGMEDPDNFVPGQTQCTLAIGDHDEHEDIATGAKWPATQTEACPKCAGTVFCACKMQSIRPQQRKHTAVEEAAARAFCEFFAAVKAWRESPARQVALRDAAVAKAIADVPAGCSASGWTNVVRVIAADVMEMGVHRTKQRRFDSFDAVFAFDVRNIRDPLTVYARARFVDGYDVDTARRRGCREANKAAVEHDFATRLFAAYEVGR